MVRNGKYIHSCTIAQHIHPSHDYPPVLPVHSSRPESSQRLSLASPSPSSLESSTTAEDYSHHRWSLWSSASSPAPVPQRTPARWHPLQSAARRGRGTAGALPTQLRAGSGHWRAVDSAPPSAQLSAASRRDDSLPETAPAQAGRAAVGGHRRADKKKDREVADLCRERASQALRLDLRTQTAQRARAHARSYAHTRPWHVQRSPYGQSGQRWTVATAT